MLRYTYPDCGGPERGTTVGCCSLRTSNLASTYVVTRYYIFDLCDPSNPPISLLATGWFKSLSATSQFLDQHQPVDHKSSQHSCWNSLWRSSSLPFWLAEEGLRNTAPSHLEAWPGTWTHRLLDLTVSPRLVSDSILCPEEPESSGRVCAHRKAHR